MTPISIHRLIVPSMLIQLGNTYEPLELIRIATHTKKPVFEATTFEIPFKLLMNMRRQASALRIRLLDESRVAFLYKLVKQSPLWVMDFIGDVTKGMTVNRGRISVNFLLSYEILPCLIFQINTRVK